MLAAIVLAVITLAVLVARVLMGKVDRCTEEQGGTLVGRRRAGREKGKRFTDAVVIVVGELEVVELLTRFRGRLVVAELNEPHGAVVDHTTPPR